MISIPTSALTKTKVKMPTMNKAMTANVESLLFGTFASLVEE